MAHLVRPLSQEQSRAIWASMSGRLSDRNYFEQNFACAVFTFDEEPSPPRVLRVRNTDCCIGPCTGTCVGPSIVRQTRALSGGRLDIDQDDEDVTESFYTLTRVLTRGPTGEMVMFDVSEPSWRWKGRVERFFSKVLDMMKRGKKEPRKG